MTLTIELPWFPSELHPNSSKHWRSKMMPKAKYREDCRKLCLGMKHDFPDGNIYTKIMFYPPSNRGDIDGFLSAAKNGIDGMCMALGINDKRLRPILLDVGPAQKGGNIIVEMG